MSHATKLFASLAVSAGLALASAGASAQMQDQSQMHGRTQADSTQTQDQNALSSGQVQKIDKDTGKLTIQHGPLANLGMPGMTMAFKVQAPSMLDQVKVGDQIRFRVESVNGTFTVTKLEVAH